MLVLQVAAMAWIAGWAVNYWIIILFGIQAVKAHSITVDNSSGTDSFSCLDDNSRGSCKTLDYALSNGMKSNDMVVYISEGNYTLKSQNLSFYELRNVSILGVGHEATIVKCLFGVGLHFQSLAQVKLAKLSLIECGLLSKSTSENRTSGESAYFRTALYFLNCIDVELNDIAVKNSSGTGVALYDVVGSVSITDSIFSFNRVSNENTEQFPGGGGIYVEFTVNRKETNVSIQYTICHCYLTDNIAASVENVDTPSTTRQHTSHVFQQFGSGGGLSINLRSSLNNGSFSVQHCNFTNNIAVWGGGIHFMVLNNSKGNQFFVESSQFINNYCPYNATMTTTGTGGGGIRFQFFPNYGSNYDQRVELRDCKFTNNSAYYGGGFSINLKREKNVSRPTTKVRLVECKWDNNSARTGSGVDIYLNDFPIGAAPTVYITNCTFKNNSNKFILNSINLLGVGALYTRSVQIQFYGENRFILNHGSAIAATGTKFVFCNDSVTVFNNNTGRQGGGIALLGVSYIELHSNTIVSFLSNRAIVKGGAIYSLVASERDFINSQNCFILYYDANAPPDEWNTSVSFTDNDSPVGKSIYCTTMLACVWSKQAEGTRADEEEIKEVFYWNGTFKYSGINNSRYLDDDISTAASEISHDSDDILRIPPGKQHQLNITALDDRHSPVNTVYLIKSNSNSHCKVSNSSMYSSNAVITLEGEINCNITIDVQTINARPLSLSIGAVIGECPPGFYVSKQGRMICRCSIFRNDEHFRGIANCDENDLVAFLRPEYWAGYTLVNNTEVLITGSCPDGYCYRNKTLLIRLPDTPSNEALDELLCRPQNRTGRLCGRCSKGHYISIHLLDYRCIRCSPKQINGIVILLLTKYLPLTLFLCVIMFFNISLVNGPLNSFILFSQVLDAMDVYSSNQVAEPSPLEHAFIAIHTFLYGVWNLNFLEMVIPPFCIFKTKTALPMLALEYAVAFYTLIVLGVLFLLAPKIKEKLFTTDNHSLQGCMVTMKRCYGRYIHLKKSANYRQGESIHAFTTLLVLCYVKVLTITIDILTPNNLYGPGGEYSKIQIMAVWVDGTLRYLDGTHGIYAAVAFLCLFTCVTIPPLLLLSYPYLPMLINKLNCHNNKILQKICIAPLDKYVPFFDAFQSCYKNEYRFFAGLYFIYRIIALCISSLAPSTENQLLCQSIFYTGVLMFHCLCQPYRKRSYNIIDGLIFANMIIINSLSTYRYYWYSTNLSTSTPVFWIQLIMIYLPVLCLVSIVLYKLICRSGYFNSGNNGLEEDALPSRLLDDVDGILKDDVQSDTDSLSNGYHLMDAASNMECGNTIASSVIQQTIP